MHFIEKIFFTSSLLFFITGCASNDLPYNPQMHPAAFAADGFTFDQGMPSRENEHWDFFYKQCEPVSPKTHFSKTSYDCLPGH